MILEAVMLNVKPNLENDFESAFQQASSIVASIDGYLSHELHRCLEVQGKYLMLIRLTTLEAHTTGFRGCLKSQRVYSNDMKISTS